MTIKTSRITFHVFTFHATNFEEIALLTIPQRIPMKLGVCYYPEHWPRERWAVDARLMREAGLEMVRLAEFAWAKMEPQPGHYEWAWLDEAIEILAGAGLEIVLGTPTATPPVWLTRQAAGYFAPGQKRPSPQPRHPPPLLPQQPHLPRLLPPHRPAMGERYGRMSASSAGRLTTNSAAAVPPAATATTAHAPFSKPGWPSDTAVSSAQRSLGHQFLVANLQRLGRNWAAPPGAD
jgi:hypothetical protein